MKKVLDQIVVIEEVGMRLFQTECKDSKTGLSMVLSEVSYNFACDWLERELKKYGRVIWKVVANYEGDGLTHIWTGEREGNLGRKFYYDEERGYLLGE